MEILTGNNPGIEKLKLLGIPQGVTSWKIRLRPASIAMIYLRYGDGKIELRPLVRVGDSAIQPEMTYDYGMNIRGKP